MSDVWHIVRQFTLHVYASSGVLLQAWFVAGLLAKKDRLWKWRNPDRVRKAAGYLHQHRVVLALVLYAVLGIWEYTNLRAGQNYIKGFFDFSSWVVGYSVTLYLLKKWKEES